jgi:hypothetical protein
LRLLGRCLVLWVEKDNATQLSRHQWKCSTLA